MRDTDLARQPARYPFLTLMPADETVAVVGGGIAGLTAALELSRRGVPFVVLEAGSRWGGVICTERVSGFLLEAGPDTLLAQKPEALQLCRELGLESRLVPTNPEQRTRRRTSRHGFSQPASALVPTLWRTAFSRAVTSSPECCRTKLSRARE